MPENNALHTAAKEGNVAEVQSQVGNFDINALDEDDGTALYWAVRHGRTQVVKLLLTLNPDVNIPDVSTPTVCVVITHTCCATFHKLNVIFRVTSSCLHFPLFDLPCFTVI